MNKFPEEISRLNEEQRQVVDLINNTSLCIFASGKAGTGKTKLIENLKTLTYKNFIVAAPTGVAAVNAGGVTLHSLFQLQVGELYTPGSLTKKFRLSSVRKKLLARIDLLIIDEISMVRADILDSVDQILKSVRNPNKPFGGIQVMFVGDLYQLPPVCKQDEWQILSKFYKSPFFIDAIIFQQASPVIIEFQKVYRQQDNTFVELLNAIRMNSVTLVQLQQLNNCVGESSGSNHLTLTTHNDIAEQINAEKLRLLPGDMVELASSMDGDFDKDSVVAEETLRLKVGAPVMLIRNLTHENEQYYNGKIGVVKVISPDRLTIEFGNKSISVGKAMWQNFDFSFDYNSQTVKSKVTGSFQQFPVRLAWSITIHKSQGLTFEHAVIDVKKSFAAGQVYVALSRLSSIEGLTLSTPLASAQVKVNPRIAAFFSSMDSLKPDPEKIAVEKHNYLKSIITSWIDLDVLSVSFSQPGSNAKTTQITQSLSTLNTHAKKFLQELNSIFILSDQEKFTRLSQRLSAGVTYFETQLGRQDDVIRQLIKEYDGDSLYKKVVIFLKEVRAIIGIKRQQLSMAKSVSTFIESRQDLGFLRAE